MITYYSGSQTWVVQVFLGCSFRKPWSAQQAVKASGSLHSRTSGLPRLEITGFLEVVSKDVLVFICLSMLATVKGKKRKGEPICHGTLTDLFQCDLLRIKICFLRHKEYKYIYIAYFYSMGVRFVSR